MIKTTTCQVQDCPHNGEPHRVNVGANETVIECGGCGNDIELVDTGEEPVGRYVPTPEEQRRIDRNWLLSQSDLKMLPDVPWDTTAWATYRQALRDLPSDPAWPNVEFPDPPADNDSP